MPVPLPEKLNVTGVAGALGWFGGVARPAISPCVAQPASSAPATRAAISVWERNRTSTSRLSLQL